MAFAKDVACPKKPPVLSVYGQGLVEVGVFENQPVTAAE